MAVYLSESGELRYFNAKTIKKMTDIPHSQHSVPRAFLIADPVTTQSSPARHYFLVFR
jgi:hypothetical protein